MKAATLLFAASASASSLRAGIVKRDLVVQTLDKWSSMGCWSDSQSSRTLEIAAHFGEHCSDTNCQYQCQQLGYSYAGTEYSGQCYCGNSVGSAAVKKPDSDCNMACTGDATQPCGGPDRMNLFTTGAVDTPSAPPPAASVAPSSGAWTAVGCYSDSVGARGLPKKVDTAGGAAKMTIQTCTDACFAAGYTLAGAEYANECYCGNAIQNGQALVSDASTCDMRCKGDATTFCGGAGRMNLYSYGGAAPATASPVASSTPVAVKPTLPSGWTTLGCYTDNNGKRALSKYFNEPEGGMTVEFCIAKCSANGYSIAGVEYGGECYCDNAVQNNHGLASDGNAGCNMACHGNAGQTCGGPGRLSTYAAGEGWKKLGCYSDQPYKRTLAINAPYTGDLTTEKCLDKCHASGYAYAGMEYGNECHCGSSFDNGGAPAADGSAGCSFACAGNSSQLCGGSQRLSTYVYINADGTISSTAPSGTGQTGTTSPSAPTPETSNLPSGWSYQNCYTDQTNGRILAVQQPDSGSLTAQSCIAACSAQGYTVAGLEYSSQCFCGNAIQNGGSVAAAGKCNMKCSGDASKTCGGPGVMDVYSSGALQTAVKPSAQTTSLPTDWAYTDCFADAVGARIFPVEIDQSAATALTCINYCQSLNYPVAGIEYANQCFCGTRDQRNAASRSDQCTMTCAGDSKYLCGGPGAMTVYSMGQQK